MERRLEDEEDEATPPVIGLEDSWTEDSEEPEVLRCSGASDAAGLVASARPGSAGGAESEPIVVDSEEGASLSLDFRWWSVGELLFRGRLVAGWREVDDFVKA